MAVLLELNESLGVKSKEHCKEVEKEIEEASPRDGSCPLLQGGEGGVAGEAEGAEQGQDHDRLVSTNSMRLQDTLQEV